MFKNIIFAGLIFIALCSGCQDRGLVLQTDFEFEIELLPVPSTVALNEQIEMRFELKTIGGSYDSTLYLIRYFQYEGKGTLTDEAGQIFVPNDAYRLSKKKFRLYFQPQKGDSHRLELVFYDNFEHRQQIELNFSIEKEQVEN